MSTLGTELLENTLDAAVTTLPAQPQQKSSSDAALNLSAAQQESILELGRRVASRLEGSALMHVALKLLSQSLKNDLHATAEFSSDRTSIVLKTVNGPLKDRLLIPSQKHPANESESLLGYASSHGAPTTTDDLDTETRFNDALLSKAGIRSGMAAPLLHGGQCLGMLLVCNAQRRAYTEHDLAFLETVANMLSVAMANARLESSWRAQRSWNESLLNYTSDIVIAVDLQGRVQHISQTCQSLTGVMPENYLGQEVWNLLVPREEQLTVRTLLHRTKAAEQPSLQAAGSLALEDGSKLKTNWTYVPVRDAQNCVAYALMCGTPSQPPAGSVAGATSGTAEMRASPRKAYSFAQMIAPAPETGAPRPDDFFLVDCQDISAGGISFQMDFRPSFNSVVIALGAPPHTTNMHAEVVRVSPRNGGASYLVGCKFTGRV